MPETHRRKLAGHDPSSRLRAIFIPLTIFAISQTACPSRDLDRARALKAEGPLVAFEVILERIPEAKAKPTRAKLVLDLSPFTHAPKIPGQPFALEPIVWMLVATVLLGAAGLAGLRRRDVG